MATGAVQPFNISLDKGLDYVTPPLLAPAGTLIDTRNYELASDMGYRRIDGYERRDNFPDGGISKWYEFTTVAPATVAGGDIITQVVTTGVLAMVVTLGYAVYVSGNVVRYVPVNGQYKLKAGTVTSAGTVATTAVDGRVIFPDPSTYLTSVRLLGAVLRGQVTDAPQEIAGTYYSRTLSYEVLNLPYISLALIGPTPPPIGESVRLNGVTYKMMYRTGGSVPRWYLLPYGTTGTVSTSVVSMSSGATVYATAGQIVGGGVQSAGSLYGYLVSVPSTLVRGRQYVTPNWQFTFNLGNVAAGTYPPLNATYHITTPGGATRISAATMSQLVKRTGSWSAGTATGRMAMLDAGFTDPARSYPQIGDEIHTTFPVTGTSRIGTINSIPTMPILAGTGSLRTAGTRYQWGTYNFYADSTLAGTYGTNGVFRAFAIGNGYANIFTQEDDALDNPKYLTFHAGVQLGLGFSTGSFQISVGGEPFNFNGLDGALEIGTGDDITGLLEAQDDSTLIFGRRSIRRVTGTTDNTLALATVCANAGAFNYTACNVGTIPVFTGPTGVSTLSQSDAYGDFIGERATSKVYNWLNPKLIPGASALEVGGIACALPVRNKNQYRLFLNTGDVVSVTFSSEGTQVMRSDYTTRDGTTNVPFAWGSSLGDDGDEHIEVVWDDVLGNLVRAPTEGTPNPKRCYRLDHGWGFDGEKFNHYFDVSWAFPTEGDTFVTPEHVRLYGSNYGIATLHLRTSGIEDDFEQPWHERIQEISMPRNPVLLKDELFPTTGIIDSGGWGLGIKFRVQNYDVTVDNVSQTEPPHIVQVVKLLTSDGKDDH